MNILDELKAREMLNNITSDEKFSKLPKGAGVYIGFDPTAPSLHLGNYIQMTMLKRFADFGFTPYAIIGGATGMIGDPSGKSEERNLLSEDVLKSNKAKIRQQLENYGFKVVDNLSFYEHMNFLDFLREVGKNVNINYMINKETVKNRLETGISFTEFSYQLIQGWDFKCLYEKHKVAIQMGGSDQWGNITTGIELIRKTLGDDNHAVGITTNLLTTSSGKKFGKSEGNAIWIDKELSSPFSLFQYLLNVGDEDVEKLLKWITYVSVEDVNKVMTAHNEDKTLRIAQKIFAEEVVRDIHGEDELQNALKLSEVLFGNISVKELPAKTLLQLANSIPTFENVTGNVKDVLLTVGVASSGRELREFISQGAIEINGKVITDENEKMETSSFDGELTIIKRGKKKFFLIKHY